MMESLSRNTAYKVWISNLISGEFIKGDGQFDSGYVSIKDKKVSRINLISNIVDKYSGDTFSSLTLDDGSGIISLKAWNENVNLFLDINIGDLVLVVGKIKQYNNSIYVTPEIVKKLDNPLWLKLRKEELLKEYGEVKKINNFEESKQVYENDNVVEEKVDGNYSSSREKVLSLVENLDTGEGAVLSKIIEKSGLNNAEATLNELLQDGEIFELGKDKFRVTG